MKNLFVVLTLCLLVISCSKEATVEEITTPISFFLDNEKIDGKLDKSQYEYLVITPRITETEFINDHYYYTTKDGYLKHGEDLGYEFHRLLAFEEEHYQFMERHPELYDIEDPAQLPDYYREFESNLIKKHSKGDSHNRVITNFYNFCTSGYLSSMPLTSVNPWFLPNNRVSGLEFYALTGVTDMFDRRFYIDRTATVAYPSGGIVQGPGSINCLEGTQANNNMSSVINLSL